MFVINTIVAGDMFREYALEHDFLYREWTEILKAEADLKLSRQSNKDASGTPDAAHSEIYSVHLKPGPIEIHPVQYAALKR